MSSYPIEDPHNVTLEFTTPYVIPEAGFDISVGLSGGGTVDDRFPIEDPNNIQLRFTTPYTPPTVGDSVTVYLGGAEDGGTGLEINVITEDSEFILSVPGHTLDEITHIDTVDSEMHIHITDHILEELLGVETGAVEYKLEVPDLDVEPLPWISTPNTEYKLEFPDCVMNDPTAASLPSVIATGGSLVQWSVSAMPPPLGSTVGTHGATDLSASRSWKKPTETDRSQSFVYKGKIHYIDESMENPFRGDLDYIDDSTTKPWQDCEFRVEDSVQQNYIMIMDYIDQFLKHPWQLGIATDYDLQDHFDVLATEFGNSQDPTRNMKWGGFVDTSESMAHKFKNGVLENIMDLQRNINWGPNWYSRLCLTQYFPYNPWEYVQLAMAVGLHGGADLSFVSPGNPRCPFTSSHSGPITVSYPIITPIYIPGAQGVYYMLNSVWVQRASDNANIAVSTVTCQIDRDSWLWDFTMTILDKSHLDLIKPQSGTFIDVRINVNGHVWICRVESWQETVVFGKTMWVISGRSPSAELSDPYDIRKSTKNDSATDAEGLVNDLLFGTGWSVNWDGTDYYQPHLWNIPANVFSMSESTTIEAIQHVVSAVGGYIQTAADTVTSKELSVYPKYKVQPWLWSGEPEDMVFNDEIASEIGRRYVSNALVDAVVVSGTTEGVVVNATRDGQLGDSDAPMVVHPLITDENAGAEAARQVLGNAGNWIKHSMRLFSLMAPGTDPGLILPGKLVKVTELSGDIYKAQVTGTQVAAQWNGDSGLMVSQTIEIEEWDVNNNS